MRVDAELRDRGLRSQEEKSNAPQVTRWRYEKRCTSSRGSGPSRGSSPEALRKRSWACRWRAAVRVWAYPNIQGESRMCGDRPVAVNSLRGAAPPREVVTEQAAERPFSLASGSSAGERYVGCAVGVAFALTTLNAHVRASDRASSDRTAVQLHCL